MAEGTKSIAFRVSPEVEEEIEQIAKANGQTKSEWIRDQVMRALYDATADSTNAPQPAGANKRPASVLQTMEARLEAFERILHGGIESLKAVMDETTTTQHKQLCDFAQLMLDFDSLTDGQLDEIRDAIRDAAERIQASQRSHKDTLLRAIARLQRSGSGRY